MSILALNSAPGRILHTYKDGEKDIPVCDDCDNLAKYEIQGETDSFGYESLYLCESCYQKMQDNEKNDDEEFLKENENLAPEGQVWLGTGVANDDYDWWYHYSQNKAEVELNLQKQDARWGAHGGVYKPHIRLVTIEEARRVAARWQHRWEEN